MRPLGHTHFVPGNWSLALASASKQAATQASVADRFQPGPASEPPRLAPETPPKNYHHLVDPGPDGVPDLLEAYHSQDPIERKVAGHHLGPYRFGFKSWERQPNPVDALKRRDNFSRGPREFPLGFWRETEEIFKLCEKLPNQQFYPVVDFVVRGKTAYEARVAKGESTFQKGVEACEGWLKKWEEEGRFESQGRAPESSRLTLRNGVPTLVTRLINQEEELPEILTPDLVDHYLSRQEPLATTDDLSFLLKLTKEVVQQKPLHQAFIRHIPEILKLAQTAEAHNSITDGFSNLHQALVSKMAEGFPEQMRRPEVLKALAPHLRSEDFLHPEVSALAAETWKSYPETLGPTLDELAKSPPNLHGDEARNKLFLRAVKEFQAEPSRQAKAWAVSQVYGLSGRGICGRTEAERTTPILDALALLEERDPATFEGLTLPFEGRDLTPKDYLKALAFESKTTITLPDVDGTVQGFDYVPSFIKYMGYDQDPGELWSLARSNGPGQEFGQIMALSLLGYMAKTDKGLRAEVIETMRDAPQPHFKVLSKELLLLDGLQKELPEEELPQPFKLRLMEPWGLSEALDAYPGDFLSNQLIRWQHPGGDLEMKRERLEFHRELKKSYHNWERIEESFCGEMDLRMKLGDKFVEERLPKIEAFYRENDLDGLKNYLHVHEIAHGSRATQLAELEFAEDEIMMGGFSLEVN